MILFRQSKQRQRDFVEALRDRKMGCVESLLRKHPRLLSKETVAEACRNGQTDVLRILLPYWSKETGCFLSDAVKFRYVGIIKLLIAYGANVNTGNAGGVRPLHLANGECLTALLQAKPIVDTENIHGDTPLIWAVRRNCVSSVKALLEAGSDVNHRNNRGVSALIVALGFPDSSQELLQLLLHHGADVRAVDGDGQCVLSRALLWQCPREEEDTDTRNYGLETVQLLLSYGAEATKSSLCIAIKHNSLDIAKTLIAHNAPVSNSVIVSAIQWQRAEFLDVLIPVATPRNHGVWLSLATKFPAVLSVLLAHVSVDTLHQGESALNRAVRMKRFQRRESVQILLAHGADPIAPDESGTCPIESASDRNDLTVIYEMVLARPDLCLLR